MSADSLASRFRTAFVTGASTGLGLAFVEMLRAEGVEVWGTSRDIARLPPRPGFHPVALELGDGAGAERSFLAAEESAGGFDLVVNNAGFSIFGSFIHSDFSAFEALIQAMLVNTARLSQAALRGMTARGRGTLVNISSIASEFALPYQSAYNLTKSGLSALNESLMYETRGTGVVIIDFRPGDFRTDIESSVRRPPGKPGPGQERAGAAFSAMMRTAPPPEDCARALRRALARNRPGTVRCGRFFQARIAPLIARFASLSLKRWIQARYFGL